MRKILLSLITMMVLMYVPASAQVTTAGIGGHVTTTNSQPLAGATVKAVHVPTGTPYVTTTLSNGRFSISGMRIGGPYTIEVSYVGYSTEKRTNIQLTLGEEATYDFPLKEEMNQMDAIVVTGTNNPIFSSTRTGSEEIITSQMIEKMPSINRSLTDYTRLAPTSMSTSQGNSYGGVSGRFNNVTVDGASFNNSFGLSSSLGATGIEPISMESLDQIQVMISPFDVRNGGFTGGGVNSVTKSGSNQWSASAYTYFKGSKLEGQKQKNISPTPAAYTSRLYGVSVGGAIIKNKLFFFVNGEIERQNTPLTWRPAKSTDLNPGTGGVSSVTEDQLKAMSSYLGTKFGYNPGSYSMSSRPTEGDRLTARLDWNITKRSNLSIKYFYLRSFYTSAPSTSGATGSTRGPNERDIPFSSAYYRVNNNFNIVMLDLDTKVSDRIHNTFKAGFSALRDYRDMDGGYFPQVDILNGSTDYTVTTFGTEANSYNNQLNTNIYQIQDYLQATLGKHQLTVGIQGDLRAFKNGFSQNYPGAWKFKTFDDFRYNADAMSMHIAIPGNNFYNFNIANYTPTGIYAPGTTGIPTQYTESYAVGNEFPYAFINVLQFGVYLQDKWSVNPKFTLTYGMRFDIPIFLSSVEHNPKFDGQLFQNGQTIDTSKLPATRVQLSPRIGFNWDALGNRHLQFRGGMGLFAGTPPYVWLSNQAGNNGLLFNSVQYSGANLAKAGFTGIIDYSKPANATAGKADIAITDPNFKYPTIFKMSLAGDWKFWDDWVFSAEFLYSKNINDIYHQNINLSNPSDWKYVSDNPSDTYDKMRPYFMTLNSGKTQYISPDANTVIKMSNTSEGYAMYSTLKLQKSFNHGTMKGLQVCGSFTFGQAKSVSDGSSSVARSAWMYRPSLNPNSPELGYSLGSFNNRLLITASYRKEYSKYFATSVGLVYDRYLPFRYSYTYSGDVNGDGIDSNDLIYIPRNKDEINLVAYKGISGFTDPRTPDQMWAQLDAFIKQDPYLSKHRGEYAQRNAACAPAFNRIDMNFTQDFFINSRTGTRHTLRLSIDIRNVANLLNKYWGVQQTTVLGNQQFQFLRVEQGPTAANNYTPSYSFVFKSVNNTAVPKSYVPLTNTFQDYINYQSRWGIQIGIKYMFN